MNLPIFIISMRITSVFYGIVLSKRRKKVLPISSERLDIHGFYGLICFSLYNKPVNKSTGHRSAATMVSIPMLGGAVQQDEIK